MRAELVELAPDADDSATPRPRTVGRPPMEWSYSLANFDQVAADGPDKLMLRQGADTSPSGMLIRIAAMPFEGSGELLRGVAVTRGQVPQAAGEVVELRPLVRYPIGLADPRSRW